MVINQQKAFSDSEAKVSLHGERRGGAGGWMETGGKGKGRERYDGKESRSGGEERENGAGFLYKRQQIPHYRPNEIGEGGITSGLRVN